MRRCDNITFFDVAGSSHTAGVQRQWFDNRETRGQRNNQFFHAVHQRMIAISAVDCEITATSVPWYLVLQEAMTTKVDCDEGCKIAPRNNRQKIHRIASTRETSCHPIARRVMMNIFYCRITMSKRRQIQFFRSNARERAK
jgi:hypothetical protein